MPAQTMRIAPRPPWSAETSATPCPAQMALDHNCAFWNNLSPKP